MTADRWEWVLLALVLVSTVVGFLMQRARRRDPGGLTARVFLYVQLALAWLHIEARKLYSRMTRGAKPPV